MSQPFTVVVPTQITDMNLVSSTVPEDDYPEYDAAATYNSGDRCIVTTGVHCIYESALDNNIGNQPEDSPAEWLKVQPTNRWAAFDESNSSTTTHNGVIQVVLVGDLINAIGVLGVNAMSVRVQAANGDLGTYYDQTISLVDNAPVLDWYDYFYAEIERDTEAVVTDIPAISGSTYTITLTGENCALSTLIFGKRFEIGYTQFNPTVSLIDYSKKDTDRWGNTVLIKGKTSKKVACSVRCEGRRVDAIRRKLESLNATPLLWLPATDEYEALTVYGFYRDFSLDIAFANESFCSLEIEGFS